MGVHEKFQRADGTPSGVYGTEKAFFQEGEAIHPGRHTKAKVDRVSNRTTDYSKNGAFNLYTATERVLARPSGFHGPYDTDFYPNAAPATGSGTGSFSSGFSDGFAT